MVSAEYDEAGPKTSMVSGAASRVEACTGEGGRGMAVRDSEFQAPGDDLPPLFEYRNGLETFDAISRRTADPPLHRGRLRRQLIADVVGLVAAAIAGPVVILAVSPNQGEAARSLSKVLPVGLAVIPLFIAIFALYGLYRGLAQRLSMSVFPDLRNIVHGLTIGGFLYVILMDLVQKAGHLPEMSVAKVVSMCVAAALLVPLARSLAWGPLASPSVRTISVIVVGTGKLASTAASHLRAQSGVSFVGFVDDHPLESRDVIGRLEDLPTLCREHGVARVVVCFSQTHPVHTTEMLKSLAGEIGVSIIPRYYDLITNNSRVEDLSGLTMLNIAPLAVSRASRFIKRLLDVVVSMVVLAVFSPLLLAVALAIKVTSRGPVFFKQTRTGRNERPFAILKFRSMYNDAESRRGELSHLNEVDGPLFKVRNDPRVTPVGRFIRRTSIDELAQLINVGKGDMSLVGPRPFVVAEAGEIDGWARKRFEVRPGMTGLWQVSGRNELSHLELCRLDYQYVASWSFWRDMEILWNTPRAVLKGRGAS
jgi:exopolysaccharide biosynthesis polyprenyl glycosylphosphotransferase